jgi:hypothetical protein
MGSPFPSRSVPGPSDLWAFREREQISDRERFFSYRKKALVEFRLSSEESPFDRPCVIKLRGLSSFELMLWKFKSFN